MSEFTIRSESVDVEQIMKQIRSRILEKRGVDYTEDQIRELASVRLERFLDPKNLRSDLLEQFRRSRPAVNTDPPSIEPPYSFEDDDIYATHRGMLRFMRRLLNPLLKLLFNPNPIIHVLHKQAEFNTDLLKREARRKIEFDQSRAAWNALYYEVLHNLVLETTRIGIEAQNMRMRVESLSSRLDFSERRVRALEGVVQYRPEAVRGPDRREHPPEPAAGVVTEGAIAEGYVPTGGLAGRPGAAQQGDGRKRRRRRRGRRGDGAGGPGMSPGATGVPNGDDAESDAASEDDDAFDAGEDGRDEPAGGAPVSSDKPTDPSDDQEQ